MRALLAPLTELGEYEEIKKMLKKQAAVTVSGCVDSEKLHMIYGLGDGFRHKIIVTFSDLKAKELYEDYQSYDDEYNVRRPDDASDSVVCSEGKYCFRQ